MPIDEIIEAARESVKEMPGDYTDPESGMLMCGKCRTPKSMRIKIFGTEQVVPVMCKCAEAEYEAEQEELREAERQRVIRIRRESCFGHGSRKASFTFNTDDGGDPQTMKLAQGYVERFEDFKARGKGLLFFGGPGTGKTFTACCIANALLNKGYTAKVTTFAEVAARLQGTWEKQDIYDELCEYDLLVLDDLGAERQTSFMDEIIFTAIDTRSSAKKPMIVTSNIDAREFAEGGEIGKNRVYSRLYEMCLPVTVNGRDRRRERMMRETAADMAMLMRAGGGADA